MRPTTRPDPDAGREEDGSAVLLMPMPRHGVEIEGEDGAEETHGSTAGQSKGQLDPPQPPDGVTAGRRIQMVRRDSGQTVDHLHILVWSRLFGALSVHFLKQSRRATLW